MDHSPHLPDGQRYIRIQSGSKRPIDEWREDENQHALESETIQSHIDGGGNVGIVCGGNLVVIDVDDPDNAPDQLDKLRSTFTVETPGGGYHYYFKSEWDETKRFDWGEIRADGGYVVAPGGEHPNGGTYELINDQEIADIVPIAFTAFVEDDTDEEDPEEVSETRDDPPSPQEVADNHEWMKTYPPEGDRSEHDFAVCCTMIRYGVPKRQVESYLESFPNSKVAERDEGVDYGGTWSKARKEVGADAGEWHLGSDTHVEPEKPSPDNNSGGSESNSSGYSTSWSKVRSIYYEQEDSQERKRARRKAAECMLENHDFKTERETEHIYAYNEDSGVYTDDGEQVIGEILWDKLGNHYSEHEVNEIKGMVRSATYHPVDEFHGPAGEVCVKNGVVDLVSGELEDHDPDYLFRRSLNVEYDPDATADTFKECLEEWVSDGAQRKKLQEYVGYCFMGWDIPFHKSLFLAGPQASGKSTFIEAVTSLFGHDSHTTLTPHELVGERFQRIELRGSLLNTSSDIPADLIEDLGMWKMITAGDRIKGERKYEDPVMFRPTTKHIFSANQLPDVYEADDAFWRRVMIVPFRDTIPKEDRDPTLLDDLNDEKPGIFNWAIEGLQRLTEQRGFTADRTVDQTRQQWEAWGTSVPRFKGRILRDNRGSYVPKDKCYDAYKEFVHDQDMLGVSKEEFGRRLMKYPHIGSKGVRINKKTKQCYTNIELREDYT